jgi:Ni,Fe-hydrogenase III large subunit
VQGNSRANIPTEDALRASNERMGETIRYLVGEVETLRSRVADLERYVYQHAHTVTYADYDGGVATNRTATVTTPR